MFCNIPLKYALLGKRHLVLVITIFLVQGELCKYLLNQLWKKYLCYKIENFKLQMRRAKEIAH